MQRKHFRFLVGTGACVALAFSQQARPSQLEKHPPAGQETPPMTVSVAEAVDSTSRSLLTQLQIPNESGELLPGAYAEITFKFTDDSRFLTIPENTLLFWREGSAVGIVHPDGKVEVRSITINRDFGNKLEVSTGLSISDQVILNPSDNLTDGVNVRIIEPSSLHVSSTWEATIAKLSTAGTIQMKQPVNEIETTKMKRVGTEGVSPEPALG
jgi:hypothetical protein